MRVADGVETDVTLDVFGELDGVTWSKEIITGMNYKRIASQ